MLTLFFLKNILLNFTRIKHSFSLQSYCDALIIIPMIAFMDELNTGLDRFQYVIVSVLTAHSYALVRHNLILIINSFFLKICYYVTNLKDIIIDSLAFSVLRC